MNRVVKKLIYSEYKRIIILIIIFIFALIISALLYHFINTYNNIHINYKNVNSMSFYSILLKVLKKNLIYIIAVIMLTILGHGNIINLFFGILSIYYGLSVIHLVKIMQIEKYYFFLTFTDYFIMFPILFYFTYISSSISKYSKKVKKVETIIHKFDIITISYLKLSFIYIAVAIAYSISYSLYIKILCRMLVK